MRTQIAVEIRRATAVCRIRALHSELDKDLILIEAARGQQSFACLRPALLGQGAQYGAEAIPLAQAEVSRLLLSGAPQSAILEWCGSRAQR